MKRQYRSNRLGFSLTKQDIRSETALNVKKVKRVKSGAYRFNRFSLFAKYMSSYIFLGLLLIGITASFVYSIVFQTIRNGIADNYSAILTNIEQQFELSMQEMDRISYEICNNDELSLIYLQASVSNTLKGITCLRSYTVSGYNLDNVFILNQQDKSIYSSTTLYHSYQADLIFSNNYNSFYADKLWKLFEDVHQNRKSLFIPFHYIDPYGAPKVSYFYIVPDLYSRKEADCRDVAFLLNSQFIESLTIPGSDIYLYDNVGNTLVGFTGDDKDLEFINSLFSSSKQISQRYETINDRFVTYAQTDDSRYSFVLVADEKNIFRPLNLLHNIFYFIIGFSLVILAAATAMTAQRYVTPVSKLASSLTKEYPDAKLTNVNGLIDFTMSMIQKKDRDYLNLMEENRPAMKEYLLQSALNGAFGSVKQFNIQGERAGLSLIEGGYMVVLFLPRGRSLTCDETASIIDSIEQSAPEFVHVYGKNDYNHSIVFLFSFLLKDSSDSIVYLKNLGTRWSKEESDIEPRFHIAASQIFSAFDEIGKGYIQALELRESMAVLSKSGIVFFNEEEALHSYGERYPHGCLKELEASLKEGDQVQSEKLIILENYTRQDFAVTMVAQHFETSPSNLSHFYKSCAHVNISEVIHDLRIKRAKQLLREIDLSIAEIVCKIGYYDVSSFTRKFKQYTGYSPGSYRKSV